MPPAGFEPTASGLGILCSILLSYRGTRGFTGTYGTLFKLALMSRGCFVAQLDGQTVFESRQMPQD